MVTQRQGQRLDDLAILRRTEELFEMRRLAEHVRISHAFLPQGFWSDLAHLQTSIYELDCYFEKNRAIEPVVLDELWTEIYNCLGLLTSKSSFDRFTQDIKVYQAIELALRDRAHFSLPSLSDYYQMKTCDVRLARNLIELHTHETGRALRLAAWDCFDLASEIMDDVDDFWEDVDSFNGNRLLLSVGEKGVHATIASYLIFLDSLQKRALLLSKQVPHDNLIIVKWCLERIEEVRAALGEDTLPGKLDEAWRQSALSTLSVSRIPNQANKASASI